MFPVATVFVVGAGAGSDIGMPVGSVLSETIARKLDFSFDGGELKRGDPEIMSTFNRLAATENSKVDDWIIAGRSIARGIQYTRSIDSYINSHREDAKIRDCAKLAIVKSILESESNTSVVWDRKTDDWTQPGSVRKSWLQIMMYLLQEKIVNRVNLEKIFENFTIINFNYDRCIEQFLYYALQQLYGINAASAGDLINSWNRIYHPYGSVGVLPWQTVGRKIGFGVRDYGDIRGLSREILTFNEQIDDVGALEEIRQTIRNAHKIVFLGFHFHQQNMDLLQADGTGPPVQVYATVVDRAAPEIAIIQQQIIAMLKPERQRLTVEVVGMRCTDLLNQYGTTLLR